jgi:hypothetical protein
VQKHIISRHVGWTNFPILILIVSPLSQTWSVNLPVRRKLNSHIDYSAACYVTLQ